MKIYRNVLCAAAGIILIVVSSCHNPFFPAKEGGKITPAETAVPVISIGGESGKSEIECNIGDKIVFTVDAEGEDEYLYQWYSNTEDSNKGGTPIEGATGPDYQPPTNEPGTTYYYVVIKNKRTGKTTVSDTVKVTVNPSAETAVPVITRQPQGAVYSMNAQAAALTVAASVSDGGILSYQWYSNRANSNTGGTLISSATNASYTPPTDTAGVVYYYAVVTNTLNGKTTQAVSNTAKIEVNENASPSAYTIVIDISGNVSGDTITASPHSADEGDTVTLSYTVANTAHYNLLDFGGVGAAIASVNSAGAGARTYTVSAADASERVITITAVFTHTNLKLDPIAFNDDTGHISKTYGDASFTNAVAAGYKGTGAISYSSSDTGVATVDSSGQVTIIKAGSAVMSAEKAADAVYAYAQVNYTLAVDAKPLTITGLSAEDKVYDGTATATASGMAALDGKLGGDDVSVAAGTAAFADKNVGTGKAVTFGGYSLGGADAGNYTLSAQPASVTANITAKSVTITGLSAANKQYDGTTTATVSGTAAINGKISADTVTVNAGTAAFANATVGNGKTVTFSGWSLSGTDAGNYTLSAQPASVTANITAKPVTITGLSATNRVYDGTTTVTITGTAAISGVVSGDTVTLGGTRAAVFASKTVGTGKTITISGYTLAGADAGNYSLTQPTLTANITAKPVTITGLSAANKQYDGTTAATVTGTAAVNGKISADTVTVSAGTAAFANATVGNNKTVTFSGWSLGGADAGNYTLSAQPASVTANITYVEMVSISAGTFTMGSPDTEAGRSTNEGPQHQVTLSGFSMGKYEVTQALYQLVMGAGTGVGTGSPSQFTAAVEGESGTPEKLPVERVSWYDALVFCNKLSVAEGLTPAYSISGSTDPAAWGTVPTGSNSTWNAVTIVSGSTGYRLPTEAQWEYACRAGTTAAFNNGNNDYTNAAAVGAVAWYASNSGSKTHQVGLKAANAWGLYDMHGNVWEWCWDWNDSSYYSSSPTSNPTGASSGTNRVWRGGGWYSTAQYVRSAYRYGNYPSSFRGTDLGFRLVRP